MTPADRAAGAGSLVDRNQGPPCDFDANKWLNPFMFQGLIGAALARHAYSDLFRFDGFAKSEADLRMIPWAAKYINNHTSPRFDNVKDPTS